MNLCANMKSWIYTLTYIYTYIHTNIYIFTLIYHMYIQTRRHTLHLLVFRLIEIHGYLLPEISYHRIERTVTFLIKTIKFWSVLRFTGVKGNNVFQKLCFWFVLFVPFFHEDSFLCCCK
jgi:hypothetical protein